MIEIKDKKRCSGCCGCANICPKKCIAMVEDEEGFWYPQVDKDKCINCGLCEKVCPILQKKIPLQTEPQVFAAYNKDKDVRMKSSSGGIFSILAETILQDGGVVFGATFDSNFEVKHDFIEKVEDLDKLRISKYVQSNIGDCYAKAKQFLDDGRTVLFTGTPCQIGGLKSFLLDKEYENLYTQDIICHGVPSPGVWRAYLKFREEKANSKIKLVTFRKKEVSWRRYTFSICFEDGTEYKKTPYFKDPMMKMFLHNKCLRPSCHDCFFKTKRRFADITLADFWGVEKVVPEMDDKMGVSLVFVHSEKGKKIFDCMKDRMFFKQVEFDKAIIKNGPMLHSVKPFGRKGLMKDFAKKPFPKVVKKHGQGIY